MKKTLNELIIEYFTNPINQNRDITQLEITSWLKVEYKKYNEVDCQDPHRSVRAMHQNGMLIKISKGIYRYDPTMTTNRELEDFSQSQKDEILKRDGYKCVICGKGLKDGVEIHVDHIKPKELGGKAVIENGQTLCGQHNYQKKTLKQTETDKKMFIRLYELAKADDNTELMSFCKDILLTFEKHDINGHIEWKE